MKEKETVRCLEKLLFGSASRVNKKGTECRGLYLLVENMEKVEKRKCVLFFDNRAGIMGED